MIKQCEEIFRLSLEMINIWLILSSLLLHNLVRDDATNIRHDFMFPLSLMQVLLKELN